MDLLNTIIDKLQATFPPNRIVALLAAPVAAGVAAGTAWVAAKFPGLPAFDSAQLTAFALAGAGAVIAAAYKWLDGWQKHEGHVAAGAVPIAKQPKRKR